MEGVKLWGSTSLKRTTNTAQLRLETVGELSSLTLATLHTLIIVACGE